MGMKSDDAFTLAVASAQSYTDETVLGGGAIKGKNCTVKSITDITGGHRVTFEWTLDDGTVKTNTMDVMDGVDGEDGKGIQSVSVNDENHLIITYSDGTTVDAGQIEIHSAVDSVNGQTGAVVLDAEDVGALPDNTPIPTKTSDLTNDSGFITKVVNDLVNYYLKSETYSKTEVDDIVTAIKNSRFEVVTTLPTTDIKTNVIYLVPKSPSQTSNVKDEYINLDGTTAGWEKIGDTEIDLSDYVTTQALNTALSAYTTTADLTTLLANKADKVSSATNGNFAGLDASGNLTDSGKKASDFASSDMATTLANYINENGAINQFDMTLSNTKSVNTGGTWEDNAFTYRGLTYTVNADNIVITGTPTDNSFFYLLAKNIPAGKYTFGGLKDAANIIWDGGFWLYNGSTETAISTGASGTKNDFTVDLSSYTFDRIKFGIKRKSNVATNDTIKLFIRKADINVDVNASYAMTNKELTNANNELTEALATKQNKPASNMAFARYVEWQGADTTRRLTMTANRSRKTLLLIDNQNVAFVYFNEANAPVIAKVNGFANLTITLVSGTLANHDTAVYDITGLTAWGSHVIVDFAQYTNGIAYDTLTLSAIPTT